MSKELEGDVLTTDEKETLVEMKEFTMKYFQTEKVQELVKESDKINKILNREKLTGRLGAIKQR